MADMKILTLGELFAAVAEYELYNHGRIYPEDVQACDGVVSLVWEPNFAYSKSWDEGVFRRVIMDDLPIGWRKMELPVSIRYCPSETGYQIVCPLTLDLILRVTSKLRLKTLDEIKAELDAI